MPLMDPSNILENRQLVDLGENALLVARLGYRFVSSQASTMEAGFSLQAPLGGPFREFAGAPLLQSLQIDMASDFGGDLLARIAWFYLKGSF